MMNLNDIVQSAQGGQAIDTLAQRFGLSPEQARAAVSALLPAIQMGLAGKASTPGGLGTVVSSIQHGAHQDTFDDPASIQSGEAAAQGGKVVGQVFGHGDVAGQVAQQASSVSGVPPQILQAMLPMLMSLVMGGLMRSMQNKGLGGVLGQVAQSGGEGGLGGIIGQVLQGAQGSGGLGGMLGQIAPSQNQAGGLGGMLGGLLGGLFGGQAAPTSSASPSAPGMNPALQNGLESLINMFHAGVPIDPGHGSALQDILGQVLQNATARR